MSEHWFQSAPVGMDRKMITILRANRTDATEILALQRLAYESEARLYNDWTIPPLRQTLEDLQHELDHMVILKAVDSGRIVGSVRGQAVAGVCEVGRLMVSPECQRRGIGSSLLQAIEAEFKDVSAFRLFTGSLSEGNIRLYARHGYGVERERPLSPLVTLVFLRKEKLAEA